MFNLLIRIFGLTKDFSDAKEWFGKRWFLSKTLWINVIAVIALLIQSKMGYVISAEEQMAILAVVNVIVRLFTNQPLVLREKDIAHLKSSEMEVDKIND